jgi:hypothetical protein
LSDVQIVLRELLDWKTRIDTKDWDFHGLRIRNAGDGTSPKDYVTLEQLTTATPEVTQPEQFHTITWTRDVLIAGQVLPGFVVGKGREGIPHELWLYAQTAPATGPLTIQFVVGGVNLLTTSLSLPSGAQGPVFSTLFIAPVPKLFQHTVVFPTVSAVNGAAIISIGLVVQRDM